MKCDLHVHTIYSGMCTVPVLKRICRESYNDPREVYSVLKRRGMDLVTLTDHDSIGAAEPLRGYADFSSAKRSLAACRLAPQCTSVRSISPNASTSKSSAAATISYACWLI